MKLKKIIIHKIKKEINQKADITFSSEIMDISNDKVISLLEELYTFFSKSIKYGIFSSEEESTFSKSFDNYVSNKGNNFMPFSKQVLSDLKGRMDSIPQSKGGYVIFSELESNNENFFTVFVVRDKNDKQFTYDKNSIVINEIVHVNTNKLAMACRINETSYCEKQDRYLSFLSTTQEDASKYFINWIGAKAQSKSQEDTNSLRSIISKISLPKDNDGNEMSREKLREYVYEICNKKLSRNINLRALSEEIWKDPDFVSSFAENSGIKINDEFTVDEKELKKLKKFSVIADNIKLDFPPEYMNKKVYFDPKDDDIVIIKSKQFAEKLKAEQ